MPHKAGVAMDIATHTGVMLIVSLIPKAATHRATAKRRAS